MQANGQRAQQNDGGGSGGGISVDCFEIDGNGRMEASGGMGSGEGGGGGGGRISVQFQHGSFLGQAKAYGGRTGKTESFICFIFRDRAYDFRFDCVPFCSLRQTCDIYMTEDSNSDFY